MSDALLIAGGVIAYLVIAALTMRIIAWAAERNGTREREMRQFGRVGEVAPGLAWPIVVPIFIVGGLLVALHAIATKGIGKGTR